MSNVATMQGSAERRYDMDRLRVGALGLLILYHVLCVFDGRPFVTKSDFAGAWADGLVALLTPWRMSLVFLIGGVAVRFLLDKLDTFAFLRDRAQRLIVPFVFAVIFLAPPQVYVAELEAGGHPGAFFDFWMHRAPVAVNYHGLGMPNLEHAWFLPYLFFYAAAAAFLWSANRGLFSQAQRWLERTPVWLLVTAFMLWFALMDAVIAPWHARSALIFTDITGHLRYVPTFVLGVLIARSNVIRSRFIAARKWLLALAALFTAASLGWLFYLGPQESGAQSVSLFAIRGLFGGVVLFAILAWAAALLNRPSKALAYASDAILPVYLLHQTLLVLAAYYTGANHWPVAVEFPYLIIVSLGGSLLIYHTLIRNSRILRVLFGLRATRRAQIESPAAAVSLQRQAV